MPSFNVQVDFTQTGAQRVTLDADKLVRALDNARAATDRLTREMETMRSSSGRAGSALNGLGKSASSANISIGKLVAGLGALTAAYAGLKAATSFIERGIKVSSQIEDARLSISSVVAATNEIKDSSGNVLEGYEKLKASTEITDEMLEKIQLLALQSTASFTDIADGVASIAAPATQAGVSLKRLPEIAVAGAQAMSAMGIPLQQMRTELEAIFTGDISKSQDILATRLGITRETVERMKQTGDFAGELLKKFEAFKLAGAEAATTWTGLQNRMRDALDFIARYASEDIFKAVKESWQKLIDLFIDSHGKIGLTEDVQGLIDKVKEVETWIADLIREYVDKLIQKIKDLNTPEGLAEFERTWEEIKTSVRSFLDLMNTVGTAISNIAALLRPVLEIINAMVEGAKSLVKALSELPLGVGLEDDLGHNGKLVFSLNRGTTESSSGKPAAPSKPKAGTGAGWDSGDLFNSDGTMNSGTETQWSGRAAGSSSRGSAIDRYTTTSTIDPKKKDSKKKSGGKSSTAGVDSALESLQRIREEVAKLNGESAGATLDKKLREIDKHAAKAKVDATELKKAYTEAFQTNVLNQFNLEMATLAGNTREVTRLQNEQSYKEKAAELKDANIPLEERNELLAKYKELLNREAATSIAQQDASFYEELNSNLMGSVEYQEAMNSLIDAQAAKWEALGYPVDAINEKVRRMRQEAASDPLSGMARGFDEWCRSAGNMADMMASTTQNALNLMTSALTEFVVNGELDFQQLLKSFISMITEMTLRMAVVSAFKFGSGLAFADGGVVSGGNISGLSNRVVSQPTFFRYRDVKAFASGDGVLGEAGPEAIMPLTRVNGQLGVRATGGSNGDSARLDRIASLLEMGLEKDSSTNVVLVDDQRRVADYFSTPEGQKTFIKCLNNNRQGIQTISNGGRA